MPFVQTPPHHQQKVEEEGNGLRYAPFGSPQEGLAASVAVCWCLLEEEQAMSAAELYSAGLRRYIIN